MEAMSAFGLFGFVFGLGAYAEVEKLKKRVKALEESGPTNPETDVAGEV